MFSGNPTMKQQQSIAELATTANALAELQVQNNDRKNKSAVIDDDDYLCLYIAILRGKDLDDPNRYPSIMSRNYKVVYWVKPGEELSTKMSGGVTPVWNHIKAILLKNIDVDLDNSFLNVEVQRVNSEADPGTSCGNVVVGRARIPFPREVDVTRRGSFPLMRIDEGIGSRLEGHIVVSLKVRRVGSDPSSISMCRWF